MRKNTRHEFAWRTVDGFAYHEGDAFESSFAVATREHFDTDTMEPIEPPWQAIKEWIPDDDPGPNWFNQERDPTGTEPENYDQSSTWQPVEVPIGDGRIVVLDDS